MTNSMLQTTVFALLVILCFAGSAIVRAADETSDGSEYRIKVYTVASDVTDGYRRFKRSARVNNITVETLGMGIEWRGGDMQSTGGGYKLNLLTKALNKLEQIDQTIVLFTDGYDIVYTQPLDVIVARFRATGAGVLFGAEHFLWPDRSVEPLYPKLTMGSRYLNSGMFIGYASNVAALLRGTDAIADTDDDQLFFTRAYLDEELRSKLKLQLDHLSTVFQNLNGAIAEVTMKFDDNGRASLINTAHGTEPAVFHGNGPSKMFLNTYGNYIADAFVNGDCVACQEQRIVLTESSLPTVTVALFIVQASPFFGDFLQLFKDLNYPKDKMDVFIYNAFPKYDDDIQALLDNAKKAYASIKQIRADDKIDESEARHLAVAHALKTKKTDYLFVIDADARLDNSETLRELLSQNRTFIAPMLKRPNEVWSNFWGALSDTGFYARSHDYMSIAEETIRGIWNVPFVSTCYLVHRSALSALNYDDVKLEPDMALCQALRQRDIFMYVSNELHFGHLVNSETYNPLLTRPDFYTMMSNPVDWKRHYIHAEYDAHLLPDAQHKQPCPDVYWFPIVSEKFCEELIAIMEAFGRWSNGTSTDERLQGGYEAVPTRDIHMNQVGLEQQWLKFLQIYVRPLQEAVFTGYFHDPPKALMNFVVRYKPTEQPFLRPHHDSSTYTINIALNRAGIDYEGGGCRFLRYNCSVTDTKIGHMLMHPGRLTHYHEGLYTTNGTRYIMITFIDP